MLLSNEQYVTVFKTAITDGRSVHQAASRLLYAAAAAAGLPARWRSTPTNYAEDNRVEELGDGGDTAKISGVPAGGWNALPSLEGWTEQLREQGIRLGLLASGDDYAEYFGKWLAKAPAEQGKLEKERKH